MVQHNYKNKVVFASLPYTGPPEASTELRALRMEKPITIKFTKYFSVLLLPGQLILEPPCTARCLELTHTMRPKVYIRKKINGAVKC
jgi:hypothetical protein